LGITCFQILEIAGRQRLQIFGGVLECPERIAFQRRVIFQHDLLRGGKPGGAQGFGRFRVGQDVRQGLLEL
jgi:hypothetical protein